MQTVESGSLSDRPSKGIALTSNFTHPQLDEKRPYTGLCPRQENLEGLLPR